MTLFACNNCNTATQGALVARPLGVPLCINCVGQLDEHATKCCNGRQMVVIGLIPRLLLICSDPNALTTWHG